MPVAGKGNQTSSLLTQSHGGEEIGEIKVEKHSAAQRGKHGGRITDEEIMFWYLSMVAWHRYGDFITVWQQHILCTVTQAVPGSTERVLLESAGSFNEPQTLRLANKLTLEYYNRKDERRRATPSSKTHTNIKTFPFFTFLPLSLASWNPFIYFAPYFLLFLHRFSAHVISFLSFVAQTCYSQMLPLSPYLPPSHFVLIFPILAGT